MSRVGKSPVSLPKSVEAYFDGDILRVVGPLGQLDKKINKIVDLSIESDQIIIKPLTDTKFATAMWGTSRSIVNNMVKGVREGFKSEIEVIGIGYRVAIKNDIISFALGKSHSIKIFIPKGISVSLVKQNHILVEGVDKERLGHFVSVLLKQRPIEPFKGKGLRLKNQFVKLKEGKKN
jgi:large subunit ribosomal protein L6